jgi:hypothetical protein
MMVSFFFYFFFFSLQMLLNFIFIFAWRIELINTQTKHCKHYCCFSHYWENILSGFLLLLIDQLTTFIKIILKPNNKM